MDKLLLLLICLVTSMLVVGCASISSAASSSYWVCPEGQAAWQDARSEAPLSAGRPHYHKCRQR